MKYRRLGRTNWQVSEVGYGMWGMAGWTGSDLDQVNQALRRAVSLGCNFFDTAWGYGAGKSEAILGNLVRDFRIANCTPRPRFHRRTGSGPAVESFHLQTVSLLTTLRNM